MGFGFSVPFVFYSGMSGPLEGYVQFQMPFLGIFAR